MVSAIWDAPQSKTGCIDAWSRHWPCSNNSEWLQLSTILFSPWFLALLISLLLKYCFRCLCIACSSNLHFLPICQWVSRRMVLRDHLQTLKLGCCIDYFDFRIRHTQFNYLFYCFEISLFNFIALWYREFLRLLWCIFWFKSRSFYLNNQYSLF
jgi:hypothetical protein